MSLRFVNGKWKGGTKKDAAKLKASSKISSSNKSSSSSGSKKSYGSYNQNQYAAYKQADAMMGTNMADTYARAYGASNKMQGPLMESGAFYSKESSDSDRNKKIRSDRNNAYSAATKKTTSSYTSNSPSSNRSLAYDWFNKIKNFVNTAPQNNQYDFTPIAPENATVQGLGGRGIFSSGQYANGKGNYGIEGSFGTGIEEDNSILSDLKGLLGNTANAQTVEDQSSYYDPSIANMIDNSRYNYMAANPTQSYVWGENPNAPYIANEAYNEPQGGENRSYNSSSNYQAPSNAGVATSPYDAYMQQQAKGYDKMIKAQKKALKEQLKAIKKQYEEAEKEGTESLNKQKFEDLLRLQGMFSFANSDPNDEQRIQYTTRTANDYATQLSTFLRKLASEKSTALKTANTEGSNALAELEQQKAAAQMKVAQIIWEAQQKAARSAYSGYNPSATSEDDSLGLW